MEATESSELIQQPLELVRHFFGKNLVINRPETLADQKVLVFPVDLTFLAEMRLIPIHIHSAPHVTCSCLARTGKGPRPKRGAGWRGGNAAYMILTSPFPTRKRTNPGREANLLIGADRLRI